MARFQMTHGTMMTETHNNDQLSIVKLGYNLVKSCNRLY